MAQYNTLADCLGRAEVRKATEKYRPVWEPIMDDHGDFNPWYDNPAKVCANPNMRQDGSCEWQTSSVIWVTPNPYPNGDPSPGYFQPPPKYDDHQGCYWYSESTGKVVHTWCPTIVPMGTPDEWKKDRTDINLDTNMWEQFGKKWFDH